MIRYEKASTYPWQSLILDRWPFANCREERDRVRWEAQVCDLLGNHPGPNKGELSEAIMHACATTVFEDSFRPSPDSLVSWLRKLRSARAAELRTVNRDMQPEDLTPEAHAAMMSVVHTNTERMKGEIAGEGYRLLDEREEMHPSDERWDRGEWRPVGSRAWFAHDVPNRKPAGWQVRRMNAPVEPRPKASAPAAGSEV